MAKSNWTRRDFFRFGAVAGGAVLGGPALLAACSKVPESGSGAGGTLDRIKKAGTVKIGIAGEVPYGYTEGGKVTGESPEVAKAVFKGMGIDNVEPTQVEFDSLIQSLTAGEFDMVCAGMAIRPDRCENATFSNVDYVTKTAFMVPKGNPEGVKTFDDVKAKGLTVAVLNGTIEQEVATALGIPADKIQPYKGQPELFQALQGNRAYCGALTDISLNYLLKDNPDAPFEVTEGFAPELKGKPQLQAGGFVFRKGEDDFVSAFNEQLDKLHGNGDWLEIVKPFGFTEGNMPPKDMTTEQLCKG